MSRGLSPAEVTALLKRPRVVSVLEVIDTRLERVMARLRVDGTLGEHIGGGFLAKPYEGPDGEPSVRISRVRFEDGTPRRAAAR